jgi:hypothetical protein
MKDCTGDGIEMDSAVELGSIRPGTMKMAAMSELRCLPLRSLWRRMTELLLYYEAANLIRLETESII